MKNRVRRLASGAGFALLAVWLVWWAYAFVRNELPFGAMTWFRAPAFGADFWSQSDYAARIWLDGGDPYAFEEHLFHYPPIVIRLFLWTPYLTEPVAVRIWITFLAGLVAWATIVALGARRHLGATCLPPSLAIAAVLFSFPVVFQLERANFDLITLAALLAALPLMKRRTARAELVAGALLSLGPWVKLYPGLIGVGLLALRRWRVLGGFVLGGVAIFAAMPREALRSFEVLKHAIAITNENARTMEFGTWSHSLSIAWKKLTEVEDPPALTKAAALISPSVFAAVAVMVPLLWVCFRIFRTRDPEPLTYPLLLWVISIASFVPQIANDYSLAFLPIAAVAVFGLRESPAAWAAFAVGLVSLQPLAFAVSGLVLLVSKVCAVLVVGVSVVRRARELDTGHDRRADLA